MIDKQLVNHIMQECIADFKNLYEIVRNRFCRFIIFYYLYSLKPAKYNEYEQSNNS